jgi:hypothetical protein
VRTVQVNNGQARVSEIVNRRVEFEAGQSGHGTLELSLERTLRGPDFCRKAISAFAGRQRNRPVP